MNNFVNMEVKYILYFQIQVYEYLLACLQTGCFHCFVDDRNIEQAEEHFLPSLSRESYRLL